MEDDYPNQNLNQQLLGSGDLQGNQQFVQRFRENTIFKEMNEYEKQQFLTYETLDYEYLDNEVNYKAEMFLQSRQFKRNIIKWIIFIFIGVAAGISAFGIDVTSEYLGKLRSNHALTNRNDGHKGLAYLQEFMLSIVFCMVSAALVQFVAPTAAGSGVSDIKAFQNGVNTSKVLTLLTYIIKIIGVGLSVGGGLAIGKEGPCIHVGAILANIFGHVPKLGRIMKSTTLKSFRNDQDKRDFIAAGMASGIAAAFGSPFGGLLFSFEQSSAYWDTSLVIKVFCSTVCSTLSVNFLLSSKDGKPNDMNFPGLLDFDLQKDNPRYKEFRYWELPFLIALGFIGGIVGGVFNWLIDKYENTRKQLFKQSKIIFIIEAGLVAFITSTSYFWLSEGAGKCHNRLDYVENKFYKEFGCGDGKYNDFASVHYTEEENKIQILFQEKIIFSTGLLFLQLFLKFFLVLLTVRVSVPQGILLPGIVIGALYGQLYGKLLKQVVDDDIFVGNYALVGAAAMLSGINRITVCCSALMIETTGEVIYLFPTFFAAVVAKYVGTIFSISMYDTDIKIKNLPYVEATPQDHQLTWQASDLMSYPVISLAGNEKVTKIIDVVEKTTHNGFPIVSDNEECLGLITRNQLIIILSNLDEVLEKQNNNEDRTLSARKFNKDFSSNKYILNNRIKDLGEFKEKYGDRVINLELYMNVSPTTIQKNATLSKVLLIYRALQLRHLIVINEDNQVLGMITRKELMSSYNRLLY